MRLRLIADVYISPVKPLLEISSISCILTEQIYKKMTQYLAPKKMTTECCNKNCLHKVQTLYMERKTKIKLGVTKNFSQRF